MFFLSFPEFQACISEFGDGISSNITNKPHFGGGDIVYEYQSSSGWAATYSLKGEWEVFFNGFKGSGDTLEAAIASHKASYEDYYRHG